VEKAMIIIPVCLRCKHLQKGMKCRSYPDGIPEEITLGKKEEGCKDFVQKNDATRPSM
jgi:hypothetical protein